jgi:serine/threonine-protein kinase
MSDLTGHSLLNRYFLRQQVGTGGMADVYLAWDNLRSAKMAVKVLRRDLVHNPRFFQMFTKEAELLRKLEHPNIVRLYEFDRQGDAAFIVLDWVDGTNLRQSISERGRPFDLEYTSRILQPLCSALGYAHQSQVFHCDVKPANVLLHVDGRVFLTDFGVARLAAEGAAGGTAPYMAPEQFSEGAVDGRTDIYALGVVLYELLTGGVLPFRGDTPASVGSTTRSRIGWEHVNQTPPPPRRFNPTIPPAVETVILTALSKRAEDRYPSALALREAFEHARARPSSQPGRPLTTGGSTISLQPTHAAEAEQPQQEIRIQVGKPHLFGLRGELAGRDVVIPPGGLTIGRGTANQLRLTERSVSRQHARIQRTRRGVYIRDLASGLGTYVNGRKIAGPTALRRGDRIQIGHQQEFEFHDE